MLVIYCSQKRYIKWRDKFPMYFPATFSLDHYHANYSGKETIQDLFNHFEKHANRTTLVVIEDIPFEISKELYKKIYEYDKTLVIIVSRENEKVFKYFHGWCEVVPPKNLVIFVNGIIWGIYHYLHYRK